MGVIKKSGICRVCIDDFATKKRHTYGTVMADIDTGRIVDMLESRESAEVATWLATFPDLRHSKRCLPLAMPKTWMGG